MTLQNNFLGGEAGAIGIISNVVSENVKFAGNYKEKFRHFSMLLLGNDDAEHIEKSQQIFINKFLDNEVEHYLKNLIHDFKLYNKSIEGGKPTFYLVPAFRSHSDSSKPTRERVDA